MSKTDRLLEKLNNKTISASELYTLLRRLGFVLDRQRGSHQCWKKGSKVLILSPHGNELKPYQIKQAIEVVKGETDEN